MIGEIPVFYVGYGLTITIGGMVEKRKPILQYVDL